MSQSAEMPKERFRFRSQGLAADALHVVRFSGHEGLNKLYNFDIMLVSRTPVDTEALMFSPAQFTIEREGDRTALFTGMPSKLTQGTQFNGWVFYTLSLQPLCQQLTRLVFNRIFLNKTVQQVVETCLSDDAFLNLDFAFSLQGAYVPQEFTMQWNETVYDFVASKLERDGISYYFDQQADHEKLVFTDSHLVHPRLHDTPPLLYSPDTGLEGQHYEEVITRFTLQRTPLPRHVIVRDYDWMRPNTPVEGVAQVSENGVGNLYFYGDGFTTEAEGERIATIRAEGLRCRGKQFFGESSVPTFRPGYLFTLEQHYDPSFNREYLITEITHEGSQEGFLSMVLGVTLEHPSDQLYYRNSFVCIPSDVQFRPERVTPRTRISGVVNAFVDSSTTSGKPEIDDYGRYRLVFPQDISGNRNGKASCWVRRAQPYTGPGYGSSFPLSPGVEVLVAFMDGDPDRPFITGTVGNAETRSVDNSATGEFSGIFTGGGGSLVFNDRDNKQGMSLHAGRSGLFMGSGSLDTLIKNCDSAVSVSNLMSTEFAGMSKSSIAGFSAMLTSGAWQKNAPWQAKCVKYIPLILKGITEGIGFGKQCFSTPGAPYDKAWDTAVAVTKSLGILSGILSYTLKNDAVQYAATLSGDDGGASLKMQSKIDGMGLKKYIAYTTLSLAASIAEVTARSIQADYGPDHEKAKTIEAYKLKMVQTPETTALKDVREHAEKIAGWLENARKEKAEAFRAKAIAEAQKKNTGLSPADQSAIDSIQLTEEEKKAELLSHWDAALSTGNRRAEYEDFEKKLTAQLNYNKKLAIVSTTFGAVEPLIGEALAIALIAKKRAFKYHSGLVPFGGLSISAPQNNVLITAKEQVRVGSDAGIVLQAMPNKLVETITKKEPKDLWEENRDPSLHTLTTESVATSMHTVGNATAVALNQKIVAISDLTLTNQFEAKGAQYETFHTSAEVAQSDYNNQLIDVAEKLVIKNRSSLDEALEVAKAEVPIDGHLLSSLDTYQRRKSDHKSFSTISMKDDSLTLSNSGHYLEISQKAPDNNEDDQFLAIKQENKDGKKLNALSFIPDRVELFAQAENNSARQVFTPTDAAFTVTADNKTSAVKLDNKSIVLDVQNQHSILVDDKVVSLKHNDALNIVLTGNGNKLDMKATTATVEATAEIALKVGNAGLKINSGGCSKITGTLLQLL